MKLLLQQKNYCGTVEIQWLARLGQLENTAQDARTGRPLRLWFIWLSWFVLFIWLVLNQTNQIDLIDKINQAVLTRDGLYCWRTESFSC